MVVYWFYTDDGCLLVFHMMQNNSLLHGVKFQKPSLFETDCWEGFRSLYFYYTYSIHDEYYYSYRHAIIKSLSRLPTSHPQCSPVRI